MAETFLNDLRMDTGPDKCRGVGMPQPVERDHRKYRQLDQLVEPARRPVGSQRSWKYVSHRYYAEQFVKRKLLGNKRPELAPLEWYEIQRSDTEWETIAGEDPNQGRLEL